MLIHEHVDVDQDIMAKVFSFQNDQFKKIIPMHFHQSIEIIYCVNGSLFVEVEQQSYMLQAGDIIALNPNVPHETKSTVKNEVFVLQIKSSFYDNEKEVLKLNTTTDCLDDALIDQLREQIVSIYFTNKRKAPHYQFLIQSKLALIKYQLATHCLVPIEKNKKWQQPKTVQKYSIIISYIKDHITEDITLAQISQEVGYTVPYLSKLFKQFTGITIMDYVNKLRLEQAIYLMRTTNKKLIDISFEAGFPNPKSFRKCLKDEFQVTPQDYLKTMDSTPLS
ncbi:AraC family transcriptional regulator [uncultured Vagococcus sp.]|uniref:AraC family transcriptional regulator n=1 Tax=uncultured Vagococcus sp. TaxID=189676 RepID=UPI0028D32EAE|nr:AraC family transcriptional regulator [uncultured Vagococcus sp.]